MMNCYEKIGLSRVVNASGRMSKLGASTISDITATQVIEAAKNYVVVDELIDRAGQIISQYTLAQDSCVCSSASAAIAISVAGLISKGKKSIIEKLPVTDGLANEVIIQKGHVINYGACEDQMIRLGGGKVVEVGMANKVEIEDIEEAINEKTICLMYVKSHHCVQKGMVSLEKMIEIAHRHGLPVLVDAAAEEDLKKYVAMGADLVCYSGHKAFEANTSGFVTGKKELISYCKKQYIGIGRAMKVGKEQIMGLLAALQQYEMKNTDEYVDKQKEIVSYLIDKLNQIKGLSCQMIQDEAGREIYRCQVKLSSKELNITAAELDKKLQEGNIKIYCRNHWTNNNIIAFDPRPMVEGDKELIVKKMIEILGEQNG